MASAPRPSGDALAAVAAIGSARWKRRPFAAYQAAVDARQARLEIQLVVCAALSSGAWLEEEALGACWDAEILTRATPGGGS
eukprot:scaffold32398_cov107-Isochrysis_galbana.AAC.2